MQSAVIVIIFLAQLAQGFNQQLATMDTENNASGIEVSNSRVSGSRPSGKSHKGTRCGKGTRSGRSGESGRGGKRTGSGPREPLLKMRHHQQRCPMVFSSMLVHVLMIMIHPA